MENPQRTPDQHLPIYEHLDITTLNRQVTEALWARDIGAEAAAASPLAAQPLEVREQYFDLVTFIVRQIGPAIGDLGHRLGADGKPNLFISAAPAPMAEAESDEGRIRPYELTRSPTCDTSPAPDAGAGLVASVVGPALWRRRGFSVLRAAHRRPRSAPSG